MGVNFGWDYPPGVTESMLPGNRPEDVAWNHYWEDTERPEAVYSELFPPPIPADLYSLYCEIKDYMEAIDKDFEAWMEPDDDRAYDARRDDQYDDESTDSDPWRAGPGDLLG